MTNHETFMRADQKYRLARNHALLKYAEYDPDIREAKAEIDCEDLLGARLEALIAYEAERLKTESAMRHAHEAVSKAYAAVRS